MYRLESTMSGNPLFYLFKLLLGLVFSILSIVILVHMYIHF